MHLGYVVTCQGRRFLVLVKPSRRFLSASDLNISEAAFIGFVDLKLLPLPLVERQKLDLWIPTSCKGSGEAKPTWHGLRSRANSVLPNPRLAASEVS